MSLIERAAQRMLEEKQKEAAASALAMTAEAAAPASPDAAEAAAIRAAAAQPATTTAATEAAQAPTAVRAETAGMLYIDENMLRAQGCLIPSETNSALAHEYRRAKRPILFNVKNEIQTHGHPNGQNLILITSAVPGEGKSFASVNLALSIASEINQTVLLIDCDVARRGASAKIGNTHTLGFLDVLAGESRVEDVLLHTNIAPLTFIPAGTSRPNADELYASDAMGELISEIGRRYSDRIILIDAPPALATNVPSILVKLMGQVLFVVEADKTPQHLVLDALQLLQGCEHIGVLLNKASRRLPGHNYYGYGYGYGYGPA